MRRSVAVLAGLLFLLNSPLAQAQTFLERLALAAETLTRQSVQYDGGYLPIPYPNGDVPANVGVCTDVVVRAYRKLDVDLQELVHVDMLNSFDDYPSHRIWGLRAPDSNIDHRRVPNLETFFTRHGERLPALTDPRAYRPGDVVSWRLAGNLPHIGIVSAQVSSDGVPLIVHNVGAGQVLEDVLFKYPVSGHFRYVPSLQPIRHSRSD